MLSHTYIIHEAYVLNPQIFASSMTCRKPGPVSVVVALSDASHRHALSCAVAKALPLVSFASSSSPKPSRAIGVSFATPSGGSVTWPGSTTSQEGDEAAALHASNTAAAAVVTHMRALIIVYFSISTFDFSTKR